MRYPFDGSPLAGGDQVSCGLSSGPDTAGVLLGVGVGEATGGGTVVPGLGVGVALGTGVCRGVIKSSVALPELPATSWEVIVARR